MRLIDVEALIDDCKKYLNELNPSRDGKECTRIHWLIGILNDAPTIEPEQQWIPVTERLPEENSDILVTYVEKDEKRIVPVNYGCGTWFDCLFNKVLNQVGVLAWMPLPEPWKDGD